MLASGKRVSARRAWASGEMRNTFLGTAGDIVVPATTMLSSPSSAKSEPGPSIQVAQRRLEPSGENLAKVFVAKLKDFAGQMTPGVVGIDEADVQPRTTTESFGVRASLVNFDSQ
jgi:hypothetical protein